MGLLGADFSDATNDPPHAEAQKFLRQKERGTTRVHQAVVLVITPNPAGGMLERFTMGWPRGRPHEAICTDKVARTIVAQKRDLGLLVIDGAL